MFPIQLFLFWELRGYSMSNISKCTRTWNRNFSLQSQENSPNDIRQVSSKIHFLTRNVKNCTFWRKNYLRSYYIFFNFLYLSILNDFNILWFSFCRIIKFVFKLCPESAKCSKLYSSIFFFEIKECLHWLLRLIYLKQFEYLTKHSKEEVLLPLQWIS